MNSRFKVLVTKNIALVEQASLIDAGAYVIAKDFIQVISVKFTLAKIPDYLVITSQNAVHSIVASKQLLYLVKIPVFCIGNTTRLLLEQYGFNVIVQADNAEQLAKIITDNFRLASFALLVGNLSLDILPQQLTAAAINFVIYQIYFTKLTPHLIAEQIDAICFFSPSAVYSYLQKNNLVDMLCFCIGNTTAKAVSPFTKHIMVADKTTIQATLAKCANYFT